MNQLILRHPGLLKGLELGDFHIIYYLSLLIT